MGSFPFPCNGCWKHSLTYLCDPVGVQIESCHYLEINSTTEINDAAIILISSLKGFSSTETGCTGKQLSHCSWVYVKGMSMYHLRKCLMVNLAVLG